ncbi:MAG: hypothetical protein ACYTG0_38630 [Planctomycetota bacterium]|jgi:hypothetical protein
MRKLLLACTGIAALCSTGCDYKVLLTNPDGAQNLIRGYVDMLATALVDWAAFADEMVTTLPF